LESKASQSPDIFPPPSRFGFWIDQKLDNCMLARHAPCCLSNFLFHFFDHPLTCLSSM
jgi:hypothetical protein